MVFLDKFCDVNGSMCFCCRKGSRAKQCSPAQPPHEPWLDKKHMHSSDVYLSGNDRVWEGNNDNVYLGEKIRAVLQMKN